MSIYEITSFRGGLSQYEDKGISGSFKFAKNLDIRKRVDSISANQALVDEGLDSSQSPSASESPSSSPSLSPSASVSHSPSPTGSSSASTSPSSSVSNSPSASQSPSASPSSSPSPSSGSGSIFDDLIVSFVEAKNGYTYGFGDTGSVYRRDADGFWVRAYKDPDGEITGAAEWYSPGKVFLYFATRTKLKRLNITGLEDWGLVEEVGNLTDSDWHTMRETGGALAIANSEYLAYVGYDESFTPETLDLVPGNIAKTLVERDGRAIIGTARKADPTKSINAAIDTEVQLAQVGDDGEIFFANMIDTIPAARFPGGGKVRPGGVCNLIKNVNFFEWEEGASSWIDKQEVGNIAVFGVYDGDSGKNGLYTYGRKSKNQPFTLNLDYEMDVDDIGAVINTNDTVLVSYRDGTDYGVMAVDPNNKATGTYEGLDFKAPVKQPQNITNWKKTELFMKPLPADCSVEFWYRIDKTGDFVQAKTDTGEDSFETTGGQKAVFFVAANGQIFEPRVVINPNGNFTPEVYRIRTYFL